MFRKNSAVIAIVAFVFLASSAQLSIADSDDQPAIPVTQSTSPSSPRYFLGLLDTRSSYGTDFFPDLFLGPEFDRDNQLEVDYLHGEASGAQNNEIDAEFEWNPIGELTVAGEFGWESEHQFITDGGDGDDAENETQTGFENVDLAIFHPIFQFVSPNRFFDDTLVARLDVAVPTRTPASGDDVQLTPYLGDLLRLGDHLSVEAWAGGQFPIAPDQTTQLIYGANLAWKFPHDQLHIPFVDVFTPMFELDGQRPMSGPADDALFGVVGFNVAFPGADDIQPRLGIGYQFPMDQGARTQLRWGVILQLFVDF